VEDAHEQIVPLMESFLTRHTSGSAPRVPSPQSLAPDP